MSTYAQCPSFALAGRIAYWDSPHRRLLCRHRAFSHQLWEPSQARMPVSLRVNGSQRAKVRPHSAVEIAYDSLPQRGTQTMPTFKVQLRYEFNSGTVNGSTERPPADLLDDNGVLMLLAAWPPQPLEVTASDEKEAVDEARRRFTDAGRRPHINERISEARFLELTRRHPPGAPGHITSVVGNWVANSGSDAWHLVYLDTPRFD
jgi:hypothetical protein